MADRIGLYLQDDYTLKASLELVRYAEARGFEAVFQSESGFTREATIALASYATVTHRVSIGSAVTNLWTRNLATLATTYSTLAQLAPDRVICGLGTWSDGYAQRVGVTRYKPLLALREAVTILRRLFALERVHFAGEVFQIQDLSLGVPSGSRGAYQIPIYIGATAQTLALAGEIGDGVLLNYLQSPYLTRQAVEEVRIGIDKAKRSHDSVDVAQMIVCSVDTDRYKALNVGRAFVARAMVQQPQLMRANGIPQDLIDEVSQLFGDGTDEGQLYEAMRQVPDDVVQHVTASGTPQEVRAKVRDYVRAGVKLPILYAITEDVRSMIDAFATGYNT